MKKYLKELVDRKRELAVELVRLEIIDLDTLVVEGLNSRDAKDIYNVALVLQEYGRINKDKKTRLEIKVRIRKLGLNLVETENIYYLKLFLENMQEDKILILDYLINKGEGESLRFVIDYLLKMRGKLDLTQEEINVNKVREELLKKAVKRLLVLDRGDILEELMLGNGEYFWEIVIDASNSKFLREFKDKLEKNRFKNNLGEEFSLKVGNTLKLRELEEGVMGEDERFRFLEELYQNNDITTILDNKEKFEELFRENRENSLTK